MKKTDLKKLKSKYHLLFLVLFLLCSLSQVYAEQVVIPAETQQSRVVTGKVIDEREDPLVGANVKVKGTAQGTSTDTDGKFSLEAPAGSTLEVTFIGFLTQSVAVSANKANYVIVLHEDVETLEEFVAVGYGIQKKSDVTGSVASVSAEDLMRTNPTNVSTGLLGAVAGLIVSRSGGADGGSTIRIRGIGTLSGSTDPLFVVDGVRVGSNADFLNPWDIKSVEILKDASATAIYGSQGANGVIMITTHKAEAGRARVNFSTNWSSSVQPEKLDVLSASGFIKSLNEAAAANGATVNPALALSLADQHQTIDWQDEMSRSSALRQNYNLSVMGGGENTRATMSLGWANNEGILIHQNFKRLTARLAVDNTIKKVIRTGLSVVYNFNQYLGGGGNMLGFAVLPPTMDEIDANGNIIHVPVRYPNGTWGHFLYANGDISQYVDNPVAVATIPTENENYVSANNSVRLDGYIEVDIMKGLTFRSTNSLNYWGGGTSNYQPIANRTFQNQNDDFDAYSVSMNGGFGMNTENYLTYNINLAKIHNLSVMLGQSFSRNMYSLNASYNGRYYASDNERTVGNMLKFDTRGGSGSLGEEFRMLSYFGRINYSLMDRYLLTATIRRDGSSNFGLLNRFGQFPSLSFAWRASEEEFIKNLNIFSNLKLRLGWGVTGNAGRADVAKLISDRIQAYWLKDGGNVDYAAGLTKDGIHDDALRWESNKQTNVGLDLGFAKNTWSFTLDYYVRQSDDLLNNKTIRPSTGFTTIYTNFGSIRNSGLEVAAVFQKPVRDWFFNVRANFATLKNEVVEVGEAPIYYSVGNGDWWTNAAVAENGHPIGTYWGYRAAGIFQSQAEIDELNKQALAAGFNFYQTQYTAPGDVKFVDLDGNGTIDDLDRDYLGHGFPTFTYGFNFSVNYKKWDASFNLHGVLGQDIMSYAYKNLTTMRSGTEGYNNILTEFYDNAWRENAKSNTYWRLTRADDNQNTRISDLFIKNGNYLKLRNIQIGYTLPRDLVKKISVDNVRVFISADELLTISSYVKGLDPEIKTDVTFNGVTNATTNGIDQGRYPLPRTFTFGLTAGF
ncbi:MAG: TonB-dependent receptor [Dysgonamonadaceae bacterium]|jgi:TonB-linked SusC/RagA family outer membrane protein|nr:TonB-dependent receptor [Dysgonamonadaceae bacterium]